MSIAEQYRQSLEAAMKEQGLTQAEMAKKTGLGQTTIGRFVRGKTVPSIEDAHIMSRALGRDLVSMLSGQGAK